MLFPSHCGPAWGNPSSSCWFHHFPSWGPRSGGSQRGEEEGWRTYRRLPLRPQPLPAGQWHPHKMRQIGGICVAFTRHSAVPCARYELCLVRQKSLSRGISAFCLGSRALGKQLRRGVCACGGTNSRITTARIPKRGVSDAGVGKPFLAEGRIGLLNPVTSLSIHTNLSVSQQQCGKEIMWLQTEGNEPGWCWSGGSFLFPAWWTADSGHISLALNNQNFSKALLGRCDFVWILSGS